jgi:hypothetical protein
MTTAVLRPFRAAVLRWRWRRRRRAGRSVRVKVGDPARFLAALDDAGGRNVVMRWLDEVPEPHEVAAFEGDVDVLVDDHPVGVAAWLAAGLPGRAKVEFRSVTGRMGGFAGEVEDKLRSLAPPLRGSSAA